jgi:hypothetical protein
MCRVRAAAQSSVFSTSRTALVLQTAFALMTAAISPICAAGVPGIKSHNFLHFGETLDLLGFLHVRSLTKSPGGFSPLQAAHSVRPSGRQTPNASRTIGSGAGSAFCQG